MKLSMLAFVVCVGLAIMASACGDGPSCKLETDTGEQLACMEYESSLLEEQAEISCNGNDGTWTDDGCNKDAALAKCAAYGSITYYYQAFVDMAGGSIMTLRETCDQLMGEFTDLSGS